MRYSRRTRCKTGVRGRPWRHQSQANEEHEEHYWQQKVRGLQEVKRGQHYKGGENSIVEGGEGVDREVGEENVGREGAGGVGGRYG